MAKENKEYKLTRADVEKKLKQVEKEWRILTQQARRAEGAYNILQELLGEFDFKEGKALKVVTGG